MACNLAALLLHDNGSDITSENLSRVLKASGLKVPGYWPILMSKALEGQNFADFLKVSGGGGRGGVTGGPGEKQEEAKEEEKEESVKESEEDLDMGGLFD